MLSKFKVVAGNKLLWADLARNESDARERWAHELGHESYSAMLLACPLIPPHVVECGY